MADVPDYDEAKHSIQEDFVEIFTEHSRQIYRFILTLTTNRADTDDVFQATSIVLLKKFDEFDPSRGTFYSWACRIAYLEVLNLRRAKRRATMLSEEVLEMLHADLMRRNSELNSREAVLEECLNKLPGDERHLIEERYYHEYTPKQLAQRAGCSVHAIYRSLAKVHGLLRRCVDRSFAAENR
ncbi:sigma-70 family RNA polymerase sigma factor [Aeoliella sp.]|uniref:sigma-70 family RNA polymerase sigma factor n=1 Tax=Aeoliella sp. TaxID=2795800 RepID=UPI003CCBCFF5